METTTIKTEEQAEREQVLREVTLLIGERRVCYCLVRVAAQYLLKVTGKGGGCVLDVGDTLSVAAYVQELYVRGRVTPETAQEIWEDLYAEKIFAGKAALMLNLQ